MDALAEAREIIDRTDEAMAELFVRRMEAVKTIAAYNQARGLPALDEARAREVLRQGALRADLASGAYEIAVDGAGRPDLEP